MQNLITNNVARRLDQRSAHTLAELLVAMASSSLLVAGLASALYIASHAIHTDDNGNRHARTAAEILTDLAGDLRLATRFDERTATAVEFTVPDRNSDGNEETIRYAWGGTAGDPLTYQLNGGAPITLADNVKHFNLAAMTREMLAETFESAPEVSEGVEFYVEDFEGTQKPEVNYESRTTLVEIPRPVEISEGDLLIAVVTHDDELEGMSALDSDWQPIDGTPLDGDGDVGLGVWWKIASSQEPESYSFSVEADEEAYAWIMRFSGHDPVAPVSNTASGDRTPEPVSPGITGVGNALVLRLGGFDGNSINPGESGLEDHQSITMNGNSRVSGGAGYSYLDEAGNSGPAYFGLTGSGEEFATATIAIAPATEE